MYARRKIGHAEISVQTGFILNQGCQIFLRNTYQNGIKYTK
jgi:hypothetical protein